jgi:hypothetical protein
MPLNQRLLRCQRNPGEPFQVLGYTHPLVKLDLGAFIVR